MNKTLASLIGLGVTLGILLFFGPKIVYALTLSQGAITYYTGYNPTTFERSTTPFTAGITTQVNNPDGSVTVNINGANGYADSGFVFYDGKLADLTDFTLTGTGDQFGLNLWFDVNNNAEYFSWTSDVFAGVDGDTYALGPGSSSNVTNITDSSQFFLISNGTTYTLAQLKAGNAPGITGDTPVAVWVGVCCGGEKSATINLAPTAVEPTPLVCTGDTHPDGNGTSCVSFSPSGPAENPYTPPQPQVLGASTGKVLGATTMAKTGTIAENIFAAIMGIGGTLSMAGFILLKKAAKLA